MGYTLDEQIADARKDLADVTKAFEVAVSEHRESWERLCHWKDALNDRAVKLNRLLSERTARQTTLPAPRSLRASACRQPGRWRDAPL